MQIRFSSSESLNPRRGLISSSYRNVLQSLTQSQGPKRQTGEWFWGHTRHRSLAPRRRERENGKKEERQTCISMRAQQRNPKKNGSRIAEKKSMTERLETSFSLISLRGRARDKFIFSPLLLHFFLFRFN
jgi:hypothetical protein